MPQLVTAAVIHAVAAAAVVSTAAEDKDYENYNPQAAIASATITKHNFAPPILCSLYHTRNLSFGYSAKKIIVKV